MYVFVHVSFFIHSSFNRYLGYSHMLASVDTTAVKQGVELMSHFLWLYAQKTDLWLIWCFHFCLETFILLSNLHQCTSLPKVYKKKCSLSSTSSLTFVHFFKIELCLKKFYIKVLKAQTIQIASKLILPTRVIVTNN